MPTAGVEQPEAVIARFWSQVKKTPNCWLWQGTLNHGYGVFRRAKRTKGLAHRFVWELVHGPIQPGLFICHHCDNPRCVNPEHLFIGTALENNQDASQKGHYTVPRRRKLTLAQRLEIAAAPRDRVTGGLLARKFGVSKVMIAHIRRGRFVQTDRRIDTGLQNVEPLRKPRTDSNQVQQQLRVSDVSHIPDGNAGRGQSSTHIG